MVGAIRELQDAGVEPDIWKIEGLDRRADCERIVAAARRGGRDSVGCIVLGRGEDEAKVREWLTTAAGVPGFIGFAVGRTDFWEPLVGWRTAVSLVVGSVTYPAAAWGHEKWHLGRPSALLRSCRLMARGLRKMESSVRRSHTTSETK